MLLYTRVHNWFVVWWCNSIKIDRYYTHPLLYFGHHTTIFKWHLGNWLHSCIVVVNSAKMFRDLAPSDVYEGRWRWRVFVLLHDIMTLPHFVPIIWVRQSSPSYIYLGKFYCLSDKRIWGTRSSEIMHSQVFMTNYCYFDNNPLVNPKIRCDGLCFLSRHVFIDGNNSILHDMAWDDIWCRCYNIEILPIVKYSLRRFTMKISTWKRDCCCSYLR